MKNPTPQQLSEIDQCFQFVLDSIEVDGIEPRSVLFGSTVGNWFKSIRGKRMRIVVAGNTPNDLYERAYLRS